MGQCRSFDRAMAGEHGLVLPHGHSSGACVQVWLQRLKGLLLLNLNGMSPVKVS